MLDTAWKAVLPQVITRRTVEPLYHRHIPGMRITDLESTERTLRRLRILGFG
jgi:hypothetical protein